MVFTHRITRLPGALFVGATLLLLQTACSSPQKSQDFFADSVKDDPMVVLIHKTALYTVYYDHALRRCVLHSAYTWGESGGGTGGTGLGVVIFACDPARLTARVEELKGRIDHGATFIPLPTSSPTAPASAAATPPQPLPAVAPPPAILQETAPPSTSNRGNND